jgi:hypothetical protein
VCCGIRVPVAVWIVLFGRLANAQTAAERGTATALQAEGLKRLDAGDAAGALEKFSAAYTLVPSPKVVFNMGRAHAELGHAVEAYRCFDRFLAEATDVPPESRGEAELMRSELRAKVAFLEVVGPPAAVLIVDGQRRGILPIARAIRVEAGGQPVVDKRLALVAGTTLRLLLEVAPAAPVLLRSSTAPGEPVERRSLFGRWWFWTAAAAVAAAGAVGVAAAAGGFSPAAGCPSDRRCR